MPTGHQSSRETALQGRVQALGWYVLRLGVLSISIEWTLYRVEAEGSVILGVRAFELAYCGVVSFFIAFLCFALFFLFFFAV